MARPSAGRDASKPLIGHHLVSSLHVLPAAITTAAISSGRPSDRRCIIVPGIVGWYTLVLTKVGTPVLK